MTRPKTTGLNNALHSTAWARYWSCTHTQFPQ